VARTISTGLVVPEAVNPTVILAALLGAITWNLITWFFGLPSSSSHALLGGFAGAAVSHYGMSAIIASGWIKPIAAIALSPLLGMGLGLTLYVSIAWLMHRAPPARLDKAFRRMQLVSAALYSLSHGANDAQKTMGIIVSLLVASHSLFAGATGWLGLFDVPNGDHVPLWVVLAAHAAIAGGTAAGGWRIVKTMGTRITKLTPFGGFCAETAGGTTIMLASALGVPVSTTHTITGAIVGVGTSRRTGAVRWGVARQIVWAWILTIPVSALIAGLVFALVG
jgi:PiT family inorganic phosphate transporter